MRATTLLVKNASRRFAVLSTAFWLNQNESDIKSIGTVSANVKKKIFEHFLQRVLSRVHLHSTLTNFEGD